MEGSRTLHGDAFASLGQVEAVLGAAPRLRLLAADVACEGVAEAHRLLRNEGAFAALRVRKVRGSLATADGEADVLALAADLPVHTSLTDVRLRGAPLGTPAALDAVVDAALTLRLPSLTLFACNVTPASAPALARLISGGALTELRVSNSARQLLDQPAARGTCRRRAACKQHSYLAQAASLQLVARHSCRGIGPGRAHGAPQPAHARP
jgi:hypothetical protein